jgi:zinc transporter ZupT
MRRRALRGARRVRQVIVLEAFGLGVIGASSLLLAGLFACWVDVPARLVGIMAGFGAGALIAAISTDLVVEAEDVLDSWQFGSSSGSRSERASRSA